VFACFELDRLIEADGCATGRVTLPLQEEEVMVATEAGQVQDFEPCHPFPGCLVLCAIDKDGNAHGCSTDSIVEQLFEDSITTRALQDKNNVATIEHMTKFDDAAFFDAIEGKRKADGLSWRELGRVLKLSPSTFSRLARGRRPDVDTFFLLLAWLNTPAEQFMKGAPEAKPQDTLATIRAILRADRAIPAEGVDALEQVMRVVYTRLKTTK
jgi:transcriptional regulator with XRE-family HTH domain